MGWRNVPDYPPKPPGGTPPKLLDQVRARVRRLGYAKRTELSYVHWVKRYILFHGKRHPRDMGKQEVEAFLTDLAVERGVAAATQNLALSAILFLYREVLAVPLPWLDDVARAKKPARLPVVLTRSEVQSMLEHTGGTAGMMLHLLYGTGMRLMECVRLRVKDVDFDLHQITVRDGKGGKDRLTVLPRSFGNVAARAARRTDRLARTAPNPAYVLKRDALRAVTKPPGPSKRKRQGCDRRGDRVLRESPSDRSQPSLRQLGPGTPSGNPRRGLGGHEVLRGPPGPTGSTS